MSRVTVSVGTAQGLAAGGRGERAGFRRLRAGPLELREAQRLLLVEGKPVRLEAKPLRVLHALLLGEGAVLGREALIAAAWGNAEHTSAASLATAMTKIRAALGESGRDLIGVVHGNGYRITVPVEIAEEPAGSEPVPVLTAGDAWPGRPGWRLEALPWTGTGGRIWLARQAETGAVGVVKFAASDSGLVALRREVELGRALQAALGTPAFLMPVRRAQLERAPFWIERPLVGPDFSFWAKAGRGLGAVGLEERLACLAVLVRAIAAAHGAGVLHGALTPSHLLVVSQPGETLRLVPIGFRGGGPGGDGPAPEQSAGAELTAAMDVYALGVLLYQCVVGDLGRPLGIGWEADIADPLLREDIAGAACVDPGRRLPSAASLAERLETLADRQLAAAMHRRAEAAAEAWQRIAERNRLRRPWVIAAACSLLTGAVVAGGFALRATAERNVARQQAALAHSVVSFLATDLLGRGNPGQSSRSDETLLQAAQAAEAEIGNRLPDQPLLAGSLHLTLATAFESRNAVALAREAYQAAIGAFTQAGVVGRADTAIAALRLAGMEALSGSPAGLARALALIARYGALPGDLGARRPEVAVWLAVARGETQMLGGDVGLAGAAFREAADAADGIPQFFDVSQRLRFRRLEAVTYLRRGLWSRAEPLFTGLRDRSLAAQGARHPDTLQLQLDLAETLSASGRMAEASTLLDQIAPDFELVFGPGHQATLNLLATRSGVLSWLGQYGRAIADQTALLARVEARDGARGFFTLAASIDLAELRCRAGQLNAGTALARATLRKASAVLGGGSTFVQAASGKLAFCMVLGGQGAEARTLLDAINIKRVSEMTSDPLYAEELAVLRTAIECAGGGNRMLFDATVLDRDDADPFYRNWSRRLARACGQPGGAG